jgi:hypothetical protein
VALILIVGVAGAVVCALLVSRMVRGRAPGPSAAWGLAAVVCFYALGNVLNRVVLPGIFGERLEMLRQHRTPVMSIMEQTLASWLGAVALTLALGAVARWVWRRPGAPVAPAPAPPQVVGSTCGVCAKRIVLALDGTSCAACHAPLHRECAAGHACPPAA